MNDYIPSLVDELYELGIRDVVLSPGSRSTPLSTLFCAYGKFSVYMNLDERCAAFFALGIAKEQNKPVALVCTSGSALAHYFPAVIEAKHSQIPLILLTADRPPESQGIGAPQTIEQNNFFGNYVKFQMELSQVSGEKSFAYTRLQAQKAYLNCQSLPKGVVQINIPLSEPLLPSFEPELFNKAKGHGFSFTPPKFNLDFDFANLEEKNGVIVCGAGTADYSLEDRKALIALAEKLKLPILADPLSQMRSHSSKSIIDAYDVFLKSDLAKKELKPEYMLLFGQSPVSKRLQNYIQEQVNISIYQIADSAIYRNCAGNTNHFVQTSLTGFVEEFNKSAKVSANSSYLELWQGWQAKALEIINSSKAEENLFEGNIITALQEHIKPNTNLCLANSMTIRDVDYFWRAKEQNIKIFCNRGANGIDGTISTALGLATQKATVLISGDLSFWHDMNGLLLAKTHGLNLLIILLNNDGGGIFQYLTHKGCDYYDYLFKTSHGLDFSGLKALYGLNYYEANSIERFTELFYELQNKQGVNLIEIKTNMEESCKLHNKYTSINI